MFEGMVNNVADMYHLVYDFVLYTKYFVLPYIFAMVRVF